MKAAWLLEDTIARRFALTITLTVAAAVALSATFFDVAGVLGRPSVEQSGLPERADDIARMIETARPADREELARAASNASFHVSWYASSSRAADVLDEELRRQPSDGEAGFQRLETLRRITYFMSDDPVATAIGVGALNADGSQARFMSLQLVDRSWLLFTVPTRFWGLPAPVQSAIRLVFLIASIGAFSAIATYQLARPIRRFSDALRRFGVDRRAAPVAETGPRELRAAVSAFNAMQAQVQRFVDDRITMLAAISHDLRTPLTRIRLRGELMEDETERRKLFRDVDEMKAMIDSALSFFRDEYENEETTTFELPELLRTIVDDCSDRGIVVGYRGPERLPFAGRPFALKRAFTNLVDNAVKYGTAPEVALDVGADRVVVVVQDRGPGIPDADKERVFAPFFRLERSRNPNTGGTGLGLTAARAVIREHGGDIVLSDRAGGGLRIAAALPVQA